MDERACCYCGSTKREMRPYGPGGSMTCFPCMKSSPDRERAAEQAYHALLDGATVISPSGAVAIGTEDGPVPFDPLSVPPGDDTRPGRVSGR